MLKIRFLHKRVKQNEREKKTVNSNGNVKPKHIGNEGAKEKSVVSENEMATATITHIHIGSTMKQKTTKELLNGRIKRAV